MDFVFTPGCQHLSKASAVAGDQLILVPAFNTGLCWLLQESIQKFPAGAVPKEALGLAEVLGWALWGLLRRLQCLVAP